MRGVQQKPTAPVLLQDWFGRGWTGRALWDNDKSGHLLASLQGILQSLGRRNAQFLVRTGTGTWWWQAFCIRPLPSGRKMVSPNQLFVSLKVLYYTAVIVVMMRKTPVVRRLCGKTEEFGSFFFLAVKSRQNFNRQLNHSENFSTGSCSNAAHTVVCNQMDCASSLSSLNLANSREKGTTTSC